MFILSKLQYFVIFKTLLKTTHFCFQMAPYLYVKILIMFALHLLAFHGFKMAYSGSNLNIIPLINPI